MLSKVARRETQVHPIGTDGLVEDRTETRSNGEPTCSDGYERQWSSLITGLVIGITLVAIVGFLAACATVDSTAMPYVGAPHPPPSDPAHVALLHDPPTQPNDALGEVVVDASTQPAPPIEQVEGRLREQAAKLGADAVLIVMDRVVPVGYYAAGPWGPYVDPVLGRRIVGVAIKYRP
jgi:hypothetical protein